MSKSGFRVRTRVGNLFAVTTACIVEYHGLKNFVMSS